MRSIKLQREQEFVKVWAFAPSALRTDSILKASQKCPCKQAFLLHGIIGHGIPLVCNCTFTYRVRENDAKRHSPTCARGQSHGITLIRNCKFTYRVCENDAKRHSPAWAGICFMRLSPLPCFARSRFYIKAMRRFPSERCPSGRLSRTSDKRPWQTNIFTKAEFQ